MEEIRGKSKEETMRDLETKIKKCIELKGDEKIEDLNYVDNYPLIMRILEWFNVKTIDNSQQRFPFHLFKEGKKKGTGWSLEHINAQNSESLNTEEQWQKWLRLHLEALKTIGESEEIRDLKSKVEEALQEENIGKKRFENLSNRVIDVLSDHDARYDMHSISNLSLLRKDDNSALNNSVFAVKRQKIIEMDKAGKYIPVCTRNVFMKYYTPVGQSQTYFWGAKDREEYLKAIKHTVYEQD